MPCEFCRSYYFFLFLCVAQEGAQQGTIKVEKPQIIKLPQFPGGDIALGNYISKTVIYPQRAKENGYSGTCVVRFTVETTGELTEVIILRGVNGCPECDIEVLRVVGIMPKWIPAEDANGPVRSFYILPVKFRLQ